MRRFDHFAVGVASGVVDMFSAFEDGSAMWTGEGPRLERREVRFSEPFVEPPSVQVSMVMWDIGANANQRADLRAAEVSRDGFQIEFRTWGDTRVARVRASWMAIGPLRHNDDFEDD
ncbi:H-type lectin domain-containing protein [Paracoccus sp. CPCC 101403]|uniref:H-type lectin domain-containing protein n=2 Tax=Paracoccus broussonetiae TaxID=3075834 RepID=A0ABU3EEL8_9RHOB|nr:H-type lectin domain-containing protein [Paracoccus sp. CPCC 101403]MDT1061865.1 H-type lectin domain-containing protein [Paracoccus sp. CPCC 101403]